MGLTGDFGVLDEWQRGILALGSPNSLHDVSAKFAAESLSRTDDEFAKQADPFGRPWAPKKRPDGRRIGQGKTGKLRSSYQVKTLSRFGFTIGSRATYRGYFSRRRALSPGRRVPGSWDNSFDRIWNTHCLLTLGLK
jgi:hypothetical protein